jgi:hypothetical protein
MITSLFVSGGECVMPYTFRGRLCGLICAECPEALSDVTVRLYRHRDKQDVISLAVAQPKDTFAILTDDAMKAKSSALIAETKTGADGSFTFELGGRDKYDGGAFEVDVYCGTVPHRKPGPPPPKPMQFTITTLQPMWRGSQEIGFRAAWEYCIPYRCWCSIRLRFGAWTICGRLTTCEGGVPIGGATVNAFDADWLQDDALGTGTTDATGHFRIDYLRSDFEKTPFSPFLNFESVGGPDVYFTVQLGSSVILAEGQAKGRTPGRENVGNCFCVELCTDKVIPPGVETQPHWMRVWEFPIHPAAPDPASHFSPEGYAGGDSNTFVFGGGILLRGNCPLTNAAAPANSLEYRFVIGEWTWSGGGGENPATMPSVQPAALKPITAIGQTTIGDLSYINGFGMADWQEVNITSADVAADGWIKVNGRPVTVDMRNGTTQVVNIGSTNFLRTDALMVMNSNAISAVHPVRMPVDLPKANAGRSLTAAEQEPIRRYRLQCEVRDASTLATIYTDTLDSIIIDNSRVILALDMEELRANACNPLAGAPLAHILYTMDHPHMRWFAVTIGNNNGTVHPPLASSPPLPALPNASFLPGPNFFFRGGAGGPHQAANDGGLPVDVSGDGPCAYRVVLGWQTRHYQDFGHSTEILYCK